jgi:hypothetical protein
MGAPLPLEAAAGAASLTCGDHLDDDALGALGRAFGGEVFDLGGEDLEQLVLWHGDPLERFDVNG